MASGMNCNYLYLNCNFQGGVVLFWLVDETGSDVRLNVHEAEVPEELLKTHHMGAEASEYTRFC